MAMNDLLANTLATINNAEIKSKASVDIRPTSDMVKGVLEILKKNNYVVDFECVKDQRGGVTKVKLAKAINGVGVIKPRFSVKIDEIEKFEKRYLPAKNFGFLIISTHDGLMTHHEAKEKNLGGSLIAYVY